MFFGLLALIACAGAPAGGGGGGLGGGGGGGGGDLSNLGTTDGGDVHGVGLGNGSANIANYNAGYYANFAQPDNPNPEKDLGYNPKLILSLYSPNNTNSCILPDGRWRIHFTGKMFKGPDSTAKTVNGWTLRVIKKSEGEYLDFKSARNEEDGSDGNVDFYLTAKADAANLDLNFVFYVLRKDYIKGPEYVELPCEGIECKKQGKIYIWARAVINLFDLGYSEPPAESSVQEEPISVVHQNPALPGFAIPPTCPPQVELKEDAAAKIQVQ